MSQVIHVGDIVMCRLEFRNNLNDRAFNILHYQLQDVSIAGGGLFSGEQASTLLPAFNTAVGGSLLPVWAGAANENVFSTGLSSQAIHPAPRSALYNTTFGAPIAGAEIGPALPLQDTPTLVKKTAVGQRWGTGRLFFVGLGQNDQTDGLVDEDLTDDLAAFGDALKATQTFAVGAVTYNFIPVLWTAPSVALPNGRATPITNVVYIDRTIKTQRRRRPGKGI